MQVGFGQSATQVVDAGPLQQAPGRERERKITVPSAMSRSARRGPPSKDRIKIPKIHYSAPRLICDKLKGAITLLEWRNWQTHGTQNPATFGSCGFDPHLQHHYRLAAPAFAFCSASIPEATVVPPRDRLTIHFILRDLHCQKTAIRSLRRPTTTTSRRQGRQKTARHSK